MLPTWLRQLKKRLSGHNGTVHRAPRLYCETLEDRVTPAVRIWTGGGIAAAGGLGTNSVNASWTNPLNWDTGVPLAGDDVIFPGPPNRASLDSSHKPPATIQNGVLVWPTNSLINANFDINNLTINDDHYRIDADGSPRTLIIRGSISANITTPLAQLSGLSLIGSFPVATSFPPPSNLTIVLPSTLQMSATGPGVLEIAVTMTQSTANVGLTKIGAGTMVLAGNNSFDGTVNVNEGTLIVANDGALGSPVNGTVVQPGAELGVASGTYADSLTIAGTGIGNAGALAAVDRPLAIFGPAGVLSGGGTWSGNITLGANTSIGSISRGNLAITGQITSSGVFDLTKVGGGTVSLQNANTYTGNTLVAAGVLDIRNDNALNNAFGTTTVATGAALSLTGNLTVSETLFLNGTGGPDNNGNPKGALRQMTTGVGSNWTGAITLLSATSIAAVNNAILTITGAFGGAFDLRKTDQGTLVFPNANTGFSGNTFIDNGTLIIKDAQALGPATAAGGPNPGGAITVNSQLGGGGGLTSGTLQVVGSYTMQKALTLYGAGFNSGGALQIVDITPTVTGSQVTWASGVTLGSATSILIQGKSSLDIQGVIDSPAGTAASLDKVNAGANGTGVLTLSNQNTYLGATNLRAGLTIIKTNTSLGGAGGNGTTVSAGATLQFANALSIVENLVLSGKGISVGGVDQGALHVTTGTNTVVGTITLLGVGSTEADINTDSGTILALNGSIGGDADMRKIGLGELQYTGNTTNTYVSKTLIDQGTLALAKSPGVVGILGPVFVGDGQGGNNVDVLRLDSSEQIAEMRPGNVPLIVTVNESGFFNLNGFTETVGGLTLQGGEVSTAGTAGPGLLTLAGDVQTNAPTVNTGTEMSIINGRLSLGNANRTFNVADGTTAVDLQVNADISGVGGLIKGGSGTMLLTSTNNTYGGLTTINAGVLAISTDGVLPSMTPVTITAAGTLDLQSHSNTVASLTGNGTLTLGTGTLTVGGDNTSTTFSGTLSGSGAGGITKVGSGTLTLASNPGAGYTGTTKVNAGTVLVAGNQGSAPVMVNDGATLGGTGTVGAVTVSTFGTIAPGIAGVGTLNTTAPVTFNGGTYAADISKVGAVTSSDTLALTGNLNPGSAPPTLLLNATAYANPVPNEVFTILTTTGGTISGGFRFKDQNGTILNEGDTYAINGRVFKISYAAAGNTAVTLTFQGLQVSSSPGSFVSDANPAVPGQQVTLKVTFSPVAPGDPVPTGSVTFSDSMGGTTFNGNPGPVTVSLLPDGSAMVTAVFTTLGTHTITATYTSTNGYQSAAPTLVETVNLPTTTTVTTSAKTVVFGTSVTFTATVTGSSGTPTGSVTFVNTTTGAVLGTKTLDANGVAQLTVNGALTGTSTIQAIYSGDPTYRGSSATVIQVVTPQPIVAAGSAQGGGGAVSIYDPRTNSLRAQFAPFGAYPGGVKVAAGDVNGDGYSDVVFMGGPGVFNGRVVIISGRDLSLLGSYTIGYGGEMNLAVGDINGDGKADVIVSTATDFDYVAVFSGATQNLLNAFSVFGGLRTGVTLAAGDFDGDGRTDIIAGTASKLGGAVVVSGRTLQRIATLAIPIPIDGVNVAAGDVNGDGKADVVLGAAKGFPIVVVFDAVTRGFRAFSAFPGQPFGVRVATTDRNGDGKADIVTTFDAAFPLGAYYDGQTFGLIDGFVQIVPGVPNSPHGLNVAAT